MTMNKEPFSASKTIKEVVHSDEYLQAPRGLALPKAIASVALGLVGYDSQQPEEVHRDNEALQKVVIGLLPSAYESQNELTQNRQQMHPTEVGHHLNQVIRYNQALRELIDNNPSVLMRDMMKFVNESASIMYSDPSDVRGIVEQTRARLDGMRHEVAAEAMFWQIPNVVDVRPATPAEDKRGIDVVVEYEDGSTEGFDIKSTSRAANEVNEKSHKPRALWTGLEWEDFGGQLRIPQQELEEHLPRFKREVASLRDLQHLASAS